MMLTTLDAMLCEVRHFLWSLVGFTWLSKVMVLYLVIVLVDLMVGYEWGFCIWCYVMNSYTCFVVVTWCWSFFGYGSNMILNMFTWLYLMMFILCWIWYCLKEYMIIVLYLFFIVHEAFQSNLAWFWTNVPSSMISLLCMHMFSYIV